MARLTSGMSFFYHEKDKQIKGASNNEKWWKNSKLGNCSVMSMSTNFGMGNMEHWQKYVTEVSRSWHFSCGGNPPYIDAEQIEHGLATENESSNVGRDAANFKVCNWRPTWVVSSSWNKMTTLHLHSNIQTYGLWLLMKLTESTDSS
jgi:hypothetical protein